MTEPARGWMMAYEVQRCPVCTRDWRMPLNHRACVEQLSAFIGGAVDSKPDEPTPEAVERVARALHAAVNVTAWEDARPIVHDLYGFLARAALAAMREPAP